jgi:hypothetical protein
MNEQDQRIAIAEACGWTREAGVTGFVRWRSPGGYIPALLPDYPRDLNAMHEAERTMTEAQHESYWRNLIKVCIDPENNNRSWIHLATAKQRAEAFCLTLNLKP